MKLKEDKNEENCVPDPDPDIRGFVLKCLLRLVLETVFPLPGNWIWIHIDG